MKYLKFLLVILSALWSGAAFGQTQTVTFSATVTSIFNSNGSGLTFASNLGIAAGNTITGSYSFDPTLADGLPSLNYWGSYTSPSPFNLALQTSSTSYSFQSNSNRIQILNGNGISPTSTTADSIDVQTLTQPVISNLPGGATLAQMILTWSDSSQTAVSNDSLIAPPQSPWDIKQMRLLAFNDGAGNQFGLFAAINSFSASGPTLVEVDLVPASGDKLLTRDTATGLDWLDLTQTLNLSFNQVEADVGGFISAGFRFATETEVKTLYQSVGITDLSNTVLSPANFPGANLLRQLMGCTGACATNAPFFRGFVKLDGSTVPLTDPRTGSSFMVLDLAAQKARGNVPGGLGSKDDHDIATGSYLVRPSVTNAPPTAEAGENQSIHAGQTVQLNGSGSSDDTTPSEDLGYSWSFTSVPVSSAAVLSGANTISPTFVADKPGDYIVRLVVADQSGVASSPDEVTISSLNTPPNANAGPDQGSVVGYTVHLDGSGSNDPDFDGLTFSWTLTGLPTGGAATLSGADTVAPSFVPNVAGIYTADLVVSDGFGNSAPDQVAITVVTGEQFAENNTTGSINIVESLSPAQVTTTGNRQALSSTLSQVVDSLQKGDVVKARNKLEQAIERTDGCALRGSPDAGGGGGGNPPAKDYVATCSEQDSVYPLLKAALDALN